MAVTFDDRLSRIRGEIPFKATTHSDGVTKPPYMNEGHARRKKGETQKRTDPSPIPPMLERLLIVFKGH